MHKTIKYKWITSGSILLVSLLLIGCTGVKTPAPEQEKLSLPAITKSATHKYYSGKFVWHDLLTDDISAAKEFYSGLFAWTFDEKDDYISIYNRGKLIGGMMQVTAKEKSAAVWLPTLSVKNVDKALVYVKAKNGKVLKGPLDMKMRGRGALVSDAQGAHLVLLRAKEGDPLDREAKIGDWLWNELWSKDPAKSDAFYRKLGTYGTSEVRDRYRILKSKGKWRAGIRDVSMVSEGEIKTRWVPVVRVDNLARSTKKVEELGGDILVTPSKVFHNGNVAIISDNVGAILILQYWSDSAAKGGK
ncbi:MAG: hypothetical protein COB07_02680 [Sulfurovum sp.]|nr:MAG: hypothetical protein COB07_07445 [Sulfurovum sp.]PHS41395.1 MAG: hypothetical protein COB07_02680 [Sulfurovum sp.]